MDGSGTGGPRWQTAPLRDGRLLRFREDLADGASAAARPFVVRLLWPFAQSASGAPGAPELGAMDRFAGRLEAAAEEVDAGILTAEVTGEGAREWVWACASAATLGGLVNALMHEFEDVRLDVEPAHDPAWGHLRSLLAARV